jgi:hypothetical protein
MRTEFKLRNETISDKVLLFQVSRGRFITYLLILLPALIILLAACGGGGGGGGGQPSGT